VIANIKIVKPVLQHIEKQLGPGLTAAENTLLIPDTTQDRRIDWGYFQQNWRSVMAASVTQPGNTAYHLYLFNKHPFAYHKEDLRTARTFLMQLCMLWQQTSVTPAELSSDTIPSLTPAASSEGESKQTAEGSRSRYQLDCIQLFARERIDTFVDSFPIPTGAELIVFGQVKGASGRPSRAAFFNQVKGGLKTLIQLDSRLSTTLTKLSEIYCQEQEGCQLIGMYLLKIKNARLQIAGNHPWQLIHFLADRGHLVIYNSESDQQNQPLLNLKKKDIILCSNSIPDQLASDQLAQIFLQSTSQPGSFLRTELIRHFRQYYTTASESQPALFLVQVD